jgi:uncharacterized protein YfdQ (DUF2303 family)
MFDREALAYLDAHLNGHEEIDAPNAESQLIALPRESQIASLENYQAQPNRIQQKVTLLSCTSFCAYVNRFKGEGSTVYLNAADGKFEAVLDHHEPGAPSWASHRAGFKPKQSIEWQAWAQMHRQKVTQLELAEFVEEHLDTFNDPSPNVMLKAALDFQSNESLTLASSQNLDDGSTRFNFAKDNVNKSVTFPHRITIGIPLFENEQPQELEARIRYRTTGEGVLTFTVAFIQDPRTIVRNAMLDIAKNIMEGTVDIFHYEGSI